MAEPKPFTINPSYRGEDFYKELGLARDADPQAIKRVYRERYFALHSDRLGNPAIKSADLDPFILEAFKNRLDRLSYAEAILTDAGTKDYYDRNYQIFQDDITERKSRYAPEIRQQALDFNEAQRRLELINNAYEKNRPQRELAQEKKKQMAQTKRDLSDADKRSGKEAELDAQIQQLDDEIARYDKEVADINEGFKKDTEARKEAEQEAKNKEEEQRIPLLIKQWDAEAKHAQVQYRLATSISEKAHWQKKIWGAYAEIERLQAEAAMKAGTEAKQEVFEDVSEEGQQAGGENAEGAGTPNDDQVENEPEPEALSQREQILRLRRERDARQREGIFDQENQIQGERIVRDYRTASNRARQAGRIRTQRANRDTGSNRLREDIRRLREERDAHREGQQTQFAEGDRPRGETQG